MQFVVYVDIAFRDPITSEVEQAFNAALRPDDPDTCAWLDERDDRILRVSFDVDAADYESAVIRAKDEVVATALPTDGRVLRVTAMTDEGQFRWTAGDGPADR